VPQRKSGIEELRKNRTKRMQNLDVKTALKKTIKKFMSSLNDKNVSEAQANLKLVHKKLDKAAKRNILAKNTVSRRKSRFSRLAKSLA